MKNIFEILCEERISKNHKLSVNLRQIHIKSNTREDKEKHTSHSKLPDHYYEMFKQRINQLKSIDSNERTCPYIEGHNMQASMILKQTN